MSFGMMLLYGSALYVIVGLCTAVAFVCFGVTRVLAQPISASLGARVMILPGAAAFWPYVLYRWLASGRR